MLAQGVCAQSGLRRAGGDTVRTANQRAYAEDVKRFKGI